MIRHNLPDLPKQTILSMRSFPIFLLATLILLDCQTVKGQFTPPASQSLIDTLYSLDSILFSETFDRCSTEVLDDLLSEDLEFYHDKTGLIATSRADFVNGVRANCENQKSGRNPKARRELVPGSMKVYPMANYGAIQMGQHNFFQFNEGRFQFTESASFTHLWKKTATGWKITRVLSYEHAPVRL